MACLVEGMECAHRRIALALVALELVDWDARITIVESAGRAAVGPVTNQVNKAACIQTGPTSHPATLMQPDYLRNAGGLKS